MGATLRPTQVRLWKIERMFVTKVAVLASYFPITSKECNSPKRSSKLTLGTCMGLMEISLASYTALLNFTFMGKSLTIDFLFTDCKSPYTTIMGRRDWTIPREVVSSSKCHYMKFPHQGRIAKVRRNQWGAHVANKIKLKEIKASDMEGSTILATFNKGKEIGK